MFTVFITGATSGFGAACARLMADQGMRLILTGRRKERLDKLTKKLSSKTDVFAAKLDVRDRGGVNRVVAALPQGFKSVDVLVNNAGLALGLELVNQGNPDEWDVMVDTNIKGILNCTQALLPGMISRNRGHIVNLGSIAGSYPYVTGNVYGATKAFVKQFSLNLKADLLGTKVRVSNIEPGMAQTEFGLVRFHGDTEKAAKPYANMNPLTAEDIARTVHWVITQPEHVTVTRLEIWPTDQSFSPFAVHRTED